MRLPTTILVPTDFSDHSAYALDYAVELAARLGAKIHVLSAIGIPALGVPELGVAITSSVMDALVKDNQAGLDAIVASHPGAPIEIVMRTGDARDVIVNTAVEVGADLIVMGTHGRRGLRRALLGSVAESVLRHAPCPVLLMRSPAEPA